MKKKVVKKKKEPTPFFNVHHPDLVGKFEKAFKVKNVQYYRAVKDYFLPAGRYKAIDTRLAEADLRMNSKMLKDYITAIKAQLKPQNNVIDIFKISNIVSDMETHTDLQFEPETIKRLAAVVFIDESEDLRDFDDEYGEKKIKFWEENNVVSFFLTKPMIEFLGLSGISEESLRKSIPTLKKIKDGLTSDLYNQFLVNK